MINADAITLEQLYPSCVALRKELDSLLVSLTCAHQTADPSGQFPHPSARANRNSLEKAPGGVAKQQRITALTRQFCLQVLSTQNAFEQKKFSLTPSQRVVWQRRVQGLVDDAGSFRREAEACVHVQQSHVVNEMHERNLLIGGASNGWGEVRNAELMYVKEKERMEESHKMLDSVLNQGWSIVGQLVNQNATMKGMRKKVLDMASSAGISSTIIGAVTRRQQADQWLVYGGMVLTLVFLFVVYRFFHYGHIFDFSGAPSAAMEEVADQMLGADV